ncbi:hypothetical protein [Calidifontibacter indicus]|uniref:hypothetical protein n=1 Tax=Calidifontibacter indicus TaxID=419650 RepID=UPI003D70426F
MNALNSGDTQDLSRILNNDRNPQDAAQRLKRFGGHRWKLLSVTSAEMSPTFRVAYLNVRDAGVAETWSIALEKTDGKVSAGPLDSPPSPGTANTGKS